MLMWIIFAFVGVVSGLIIAWSLDMTSPKETLPGILGWANCGFANVGHAAALIIAV